MLRNAASLSNYPTSTLAGLPAAASAQGQIVRVSDFGVAGVGLLVISDGVRWLPLGPQLLARSGVSTSVTGTTAETTLASVAVPAGLLGINGGLRVYSSWSYTNSANNKTLRAKFGGTSFFAFVQSTSSTIHDFRRGRNRNSAGSQVWGIGSGQGVFAGAATTAPLTTAIDTTQAQNVDFTGQLALGTESASLDNYEVWVTP